MYYRFHTIFGKWFLAEDVFCKVALDPFQKTMGMGRGERPIPTIDCI